MRVLHGISPAPGFILPRTPSSRLRRLRPRILREIAQLFFILFFSHFSSSLLPFISILFTHSIQSIRFTTSLLRFIIFIVLSQHRSCCFFLEAQALSARGKSLLLHLRGGNSPDLPSLIPIISIHSIPIYPFSTLLFFTWAKRPSIISLLCSSRRSLPSLTF